MKRKRGRRSAVRHARRLATGKASTYIWPFDTIRPGDKVVLWCRVSSGPQDTNGNNADQETELRAAVEARGGIVVGVERFAGRVELGSRRLKHASPLITTVYKFSKNVWAFWRAFFALKLVGFA